LNEIICLLHFDVLVPHRTSVGFCKLSVHRKKYEGLFLTLGSKIRVISVTWALIVWIVYWCII
jgi:hypothetical protein